MIEEIINQEYSKRFPLDSSLKEKPANDYGVIKNFAEILSILDKNPEIKVISFDFMNTLIEWTSNSKERYARMYLAASQIFGKYGCNITPEEYRAIRNPIWYSQKKRHACQGTDFKAFDVLLEIVYRTLGPKQKELLSKSPTIAQELEQSIYQIEKETAVLTPKIEKLLKELKKRDIRTVVYSNTPFSSKHVTDVLESLGISKYFDRVITSSEFGFQKSEHFPEGFQKLAWELKNSYRLNSARKGILHVGDNAKEDYQGALKSGLCAVHLDNHLAFSQKLGSLDINTKEYQTNVVKCLKESLDERIERMIEESLGPELDSSYVKDFLMRAYHLARDIYGPVQVHFSDKRLKSLRNNPKKIAVCLGRDGLGSFQTMKKLLQLNPRAYSNVNEKQIRYVNFSRKVIQKALKDGGFDYFPGHKGRIDKKIKLNPSGDETYSGYKKLLYDYLQQEGFDEAEEIRLIDSGLQGSSQTAVQSLFPEWAKKIQGRYLYAYQKCEDPFKNCKDGYLLLFKSNMPDPVSQIKIVHGDPFYINQSQIYFFEDLFNGPEESNSHLDIVYDESGYRKIIPRIKTMLYNPDVNPEKVPSELKYSQIYPLVKELLIKGLEDSAELYSRAKQVDPDLSNQVFPREEEAKMILKQYLISYRKYLKENTPHPDSDIFDDLIRKTDYKEQQEKYHQLWKNHLQD